MNNPKLYVIRNPKVEEAVNKRETSVIGEDGQIYPVRSANIKGVTAKALLLVHSPIPPPSEVMSVKDAVDIDKALGDDGNEHNCPLCNEYFPSLAFRAHAQQCIDARAPRRRIWTPPGVKNAIQAFKDKIKPDFAEKSGG